ncbi:MAG: response regulator [Prolixibacteraceae bacterium]|nr:response regulator [Prolixibacteraceae bacterium]
MNLNFANRFLLLILPICFLFQINSFGQKPFWGKAEAELKFKHLTAEQGLSSNVTSIILKDHQGFMWFGTDAGLNKYDGFQIKTYNYGDEQKNTLSNGVIKSLFEDKSRRIWIGTDKGLNLYNPVDELLVHFLSEADNPGSLSNNTISAITEDKNGSLWIGTFYGLNKLTSWENEQPSFQRFYSEYTDSSTLSNNRIFCLFSDSNDNLWIGTEGGGLSLLSAEDKNYGTFKFQHISSKRPDNSEFGESVIFTIEEDNQGNILVGSDNGFTIIDTKQSEITFKHYLPKRDAENWFSEENIYSIVEDGNGQIWIGTFGGGLFLFNPREETFKKYQHDVYNDQSISRNHLFSVNSTDDGLLWIAARETGIDRVNPGTQIFTHLQHIPNNSNSLSNNVIKAISESPDGKFWFGTFGGGLNKYDPTTASFEAFYHDPNNSASLCSDIVESTCFDYLGQLWIGTTKGVNMYNPKTDQFQSFKHDSQNPNSISDANIWFIFPAKDESGIWIATYDGLDKYDWNENKFYHFKNNSQVETSLSFNFIRAVYEDDDQNLWICSWGGGLDQLVLKENTNLQNAQFIHHTHNPDDKNSISNDLVNTIFEDSKGRLWVGTQEGLNLFNKQTREFQSFFKSDGLADNVIKGIQEDMSGTIWISTQNGLSSFNPEDNKFRNYYKKDGLQGDIFNLSSCIRNSRNELMFGGNSGVSVFNPEKILKKSEFPKVYFTGIKINSQNIYPGEEVGDRVLFNKSLNLSPKIELKHNENVINFDFTAIEYVYPEKIEFAYKLEGADKDWNYAPYNNRMVIYTGLKRGKYKFRIKASNINGEWGDNEKTIEFKISPPLAKTNLAILLYVLVILTIVYFIREQMKARIRIKRELAKEKEEHKCQVEIDQFKLQFFTNISHEFRTPLTLISGPLQKLINSKGKLPETQKENYLNMMNRSVSILSKLVEQLLDFRKAEKNKMKLHVSYSDIGEQLRNLSDNFQDFASQKNLDFSFESDHDSVHYWYDQDKVEKIYYNLLSNAFKFTPVGGTIKVSLKNKGEIDFLSNVTNESEEDYFCLVVEDTGKGISEDNKQYIFDRFAQIDSGKLNVGGTGIGLSFTKKMVELHRGFIQLESEVGVGSMFYVWLPALENFFTEEEITQKVTAEKDYVETVNSLPLPLLPDSEDSGDDQPISSKKITILIVEDYNDLRNFLAEIFNKKYNILLASNGREGLEKVHRNGPDLIITDVMMPEMDGLEFTKSVKKNLSSNHIPIIMLTAKNTRDSEIEGLETGADYYISKPFNVEQLQLVVKNIIENRTKLHQKYAGVKMPEPKEVEVISIDEKFMTKVGEVIEENISEPEFSVEKLASETNLSTVHLYRKLKALTGMTPNEFIRSFRMKRATQLLRQKKLMISEVAYAVGFNDPKYFRKCFKKAFGVSPSEFEK